MFITEKDFHGFVKGKEKPFETIFRQYYKTLVSFAMRYGLEQMEAEDVVVEVIYRIWKIRQELKSPAALNTLFYTAVRNRSINVRRNILSREKILMKEQVKEEREFLDHVMEEELSRLLDQAVETLPLQCRQVILSLLAGKSVAEIAVDMSVSVNTIKTYKHRAIEILREKLRNYSVLWCLFMIRLGD